MMTGEDEPFGSRKIRYDDEAYCMEAHGLLDHQKKIGCCEDIFFWGEKSRTQKWQILLHSFVKAQHKWQNLEKTADYLFKEQMLAN